MKQTLVFDREHYTQIDEARLNFLKQWLPELVRTWGLKNVLDVGCGAGFFSGYLASLGLKVTAFDARSENVSVAQRRHPDIKFLVNDIEDTTVKRLGPFDLIFCFGLLYHLENPFLAVRNLHALTEKVLLIESRVTPGPFPSARLVDEIISEDQSMNYIALIPSELGLIKMLYSSGFRYVYLSRIVPDHEDFRESVRLHRKRAIIVASKIALEVSFLQRVDEPAKIDPWIKTLGSRLNRVRNFLSKPWQQKVMSIRRRFKGLWLRLLPSIPLPIRLPYGGWWINRNDNLSNMISRRKFEEAEWHFVNRFLKKGMTVVDVGAHHGFYTILCSKKVGVTGKVFAFEPSPGEQRKLSFHLKLNRCKNVKIEPYALAGQSGKATLFVTKGWYTAFNSLRPPALSVPTQEVKVSTIRLDDYLRSLQLEKVDLIKIDTEGAELEILQGAENLLMTESSPVIMIEVCDERTRPWGYPSAAIHDFLAQRGYAWFSVADDGYLRLDGKGTDFYNFVAVPKWKLHEMRVYLKETRQVPSELRHFVESGKRDA
jgi:FkbM family methyltransferase